SVSLYTLRRNRFAIPWYRFDTSEFFVGHAVSSSIFDDLADFNAILSSRRWLGFTASGLSPDKKRLALLGAQQLYCST
ncbi:MAG: hypothetical protein ACJA1W_003563, partial [Akkermansiaceae bacterium]